MTTIPDTPRDLFAFFFDNQAVRSGPDGDALIESFYDLLAPFLLDLGEHGASADLFGPGSFAAGSFAPAPGGPSEGGTGDGRQDGGSHDGGSHGGQDGGHGGTDGLTLALGLLGGFGRGDLDI